MVRGRYWEEERPLFVRGRIVNNISIRIPARRLALALVAVATFLAIQSITLRALQYWVGMHNTYWLYQYSELTNINREANIPTWFSSAILLAAAGLLLITNLAQRAEGKARLGWAGTTAIFTYISLDETGTIHEKLTAILQARLELTRYFYFGWIMVGIAVALA